MRAVKRGNAQGADVAAGSSVPLLPVASGPDLPFVKDLAIGCSEPTT